MQLHKQLSQIRHNAGLKQIDIAGILGVSQARISEYESGKREISLPTLRKWAEICGYDFNIQFTKKPG